MANPLFNKLFGGFQPFQSGEGQTMPIASQTSAMPSNGQQMTMMDAMNKLRSDPVQAIRQAGYNVPDEIANNPQATVMHLIQTGQVSSPMMQRIQPMMNMLMGRR